MKKNIKNPVLVADCLEIYSLKTSDLVPAKAENSTLKS